MNENTLAKKLQVKQSQSILLVNAPENYHESLLPLPDNTTIDTIPTGKYDLIQVFAKSKSELKKEIWKVEKILQPQTILWISYPKKNSGIETDLEMTGNWQIMDDLSLRPVSSISIDEKWTALRFKPISEVKKSGSGNDDIQQNEYGDYIDVINKKITVPEEIKSLLENESSASSFFNSLSYSNKKEFIIWILSAKQETTKEKRLSKMVELLKAGKKNPSPK